MAHYNNKKTGENTTPNDKQQPIRIQTRNINPGCNTKIEQYIQESEKRIQNTNGSAQSLRRNQQNAAMDNTIQERPTPRNNPTH